jgi:plasmid stabilization system protein ParE
MTVPVELTSKAMSDLAQITGHVKIYNDVATTRAVIKALFAAEHNAPAVSDPPLYAGKLAPQLAEAGVSATWRGLAGLARCNG